MGLLSSSKIGNSIPHIPNRKERRKRAKEAGLFKTKHKGAWQHVNNAAYEQRDEAIHKLVHRANQKHNLKKGSEDAPKE
jgi:hypothetical protein